jgi:hypothetical protein
MNCFGTSIRPGGGSGGSGSELGFFLNASPVTNGTPGQVFTTPTSYVSGALVCFVGSVLIVNGDITELTPTTFSFTSFTPIPGQTVRCFYEEP